MTKVRKNLVGKIFGRLIVKEQYEDYISPLGKHLTQWLCECNCEKHNKVVVLGCNLVKGCTKSCGCLKQQILSTRLNKTNEYEIQEDYVIMYTGKGEPFFVDLEDFWKVRDICWHKNDEGYIVGVLNGKTTRIHRLIMDAPNGLDVDHKYGKQTRNDNRKYNLRIATRSQNNVNRDIQKNNTSGTAGVYKHNQCDKWTANVWRNNKTIYLGLFDTKEEAIAARKDAENEYYGEFSYDNSQMLVNSS